MPVRARPPRRRVPIRACPVLGSRTARPASSTRQTSAPSRLHIRNRPRPAPCRTAFAASSCTAMVTSRARAAGIPAADACAATAYRTAYSGPPKNSSSSSSAPGPAAAS
jgi:hypothetical protein